MATLDRLGPPASVPTPSASTWSPRRAIAAALTVAAAIALLQVVMSSSFTHTGHQLQRLQDQRSQLKAEIYELEAEVAALASLERTERAARERLGMTAVQPRAFIEVNVEAPSGPLLPRPLLSLRAEAVGPAKPWWRTLFEALPIP
jgi:cell division protein FtsL